MACRDHLVEVAKFLPDLQSLGVETFAVSFSPPDVLRSFLAENSQPFPVLSDADRSAYNALGLSRTSFWTFLRPDVIAGYLRMIFRGTKMLKPIPKDDLFQLGGDFIIDRQGVLRFAHLSKDPTDRPSGSRLVEELRKLT